MSARAEKRKTRSRRLGSRDLRALARKLANAREPAEAARLKQRITRGFYGL